MHTLLGDASNYTHNYSYLTSNPVAESHDPLSNSAPGNSAWTAGAGGSKQVPVTVLQGLSKGSLKGSIPIWGLFIFQCSFRAPTRDLRGVTRPSK